MLIDITLNLTPRLQREAATNTKPELLDHVGTHFDAMGMEFPLEYTKRAGIVFDVSRVSDREIELTDIDLKRVEPNMFVAFYSGFIEKVGYGQADYFRRHPVLSYSLIEALVGRGISIIGLDFGGIRTSVEHIPADKYCADNGTFVVENLVGLKKLVDGGGRFIAHTYPMKLEGLSGLPCRVIAEI